MIFRAYYIFKRYKNNHFRVYSNRFSEKKHY